MVNGKSICTAMAICCTVFVTVSAQDDEWFRDYNRNKKLLAVKTGLGTGSKYGGTGGGVNGEFYVGYFGISFGCGLIVPNEVMSRTNSGDPKKDMETDFGWQTGIKVYTAPSAFSLRPTINFHIGNVYAYQINYYGEILRGKYISFTPSVIVEHDIGRPRGFSLSYGMGLIFHEPIPDDHWEVRNELKKDLAHILLSPVVGLNYNIF